MCSSLGRHHSKSARARHTTSAQPPTGSSTCRSHRCTTPRSMLWRGRLVRVEVCTGYLRRLVCLSSLTRRSICPRMTPFFCPRRLMSTLVFPGALLLSNKTTVPARPARAERPARWSSSSALLFAWCTDVAPRRPASGRNTWRTCGPKSRPRDRSDVVISTRGASASRSRRVYGRWRNRARSLSVRAWRASASPVKATWLG